MGKRTLFHPVGLHIIRGAAEHCGYLFGRLKQTGISHDLKHAVYVTEIVEMNAEDRDNGLSEIQFDLDACFAEDVNVTLIWRTRSGKLMVQIETYAMTLHQLSFDEHEELLNELGDIQRVEDELEPDDLPF